MRSGLPFLLPLFLISCTAGTNGDEASSTVRVHKISDPEDLNPMTSSGADALELQRQLFQCLLDYDPWSEKLTPVLAERVPKPKLLNDSTIRIEFVIREEAEWRDGTPIDARDVAFTVKAALLPRVRNEHKRPYLQRIRKLVTNEENPRRIGFICDRYIRNLHSTGAELAILPSQLLDPERILAELSLDEIRKKRDSLSESEAIKELASSLNKKGRKETLPMGSGPYSLEKWERGRRIELKRKTDWWGDRLDTIPNPYFKAAPKRILHQVISDRNSAIQALRSEELDVMTHIPANRFEKLAASERIQERFERYIAPQLGYTHITLQMQDPLLRSRHTRKALALLVDRTRIKKAITAGHGKDLVGPVHPDKTLFYNDSLSPHRFDPEKAKSALAEAGWEDRDGDAVLEKRIDGEERELKLEFLYNAGSESRKKVGVLLKEEARKCGVGIELRAAEWSLYQELMRKKEFQLAIGGFAFPNAPQDPKQLFHSSASDGGSNHSGFGSAHSDSIIDSLRITMDREKRREYWYALQERIHEEVPMIFIQTSVNRIAVHRRFGKVQTSRIVPGYWVMAFEEDRDGKGGIEARTAF